MKSRPEAVEELQLCAISDRVTGWVGSKAQLETDDSAPRSELGDRHALQLPSLETQELLMRTG